MEARRKVRRLDDAQDHEVRGPLIKAKLTDKQRAAIEKDLHLLEDALRGDSIIVGVDIRLTEYVGTASTRAQKLKSIRFVDPRSEPADGL